MRPAGRSLRGLRSFAGSEDLQRVEVGCFPRDAAFELGLQSIRAVYPEIGIVDEQPMVGRQRDRPVNRFETLLKERVVVVDASPALSVIAVSDVELRARIAVRRVRALEGHSRFGERIAAKEGQRV